MRIYPFFLLFCLAFSAWNCASSRPSSNAAKSDPTINTGYTEQDPRTFSGSATVMEDADNTLDLTDQLRKARGVYVTGNGASARIKVQSGANSLTSGTEPLFIVNGSQMRNYQETYDLVSFSHIKTLTVLKDPSTTAMYGTRGANGVILIELD